MAFRGIRKLLTGLCASAALWLALPAAAWAQQNCAPCAATFGVPCGVGCQTHHCPPAFKYCYEGAPHIHWKRGCPHPICNPCDLPHWGYYDTCWSPWPFPPNWSHCPTPPPAAFVTLDPYVGRQMPAVRTMPPAFQTPGVAPAPTFPNGRTEEVLPTLPTPRPKQ